MVFSNKLYSLRKQRGLSQDELGSRLNVSRQTVSKWELGETTPELEKLIALSDFFEVSLDELVMETKEVKSSDDSTKTETVKKGYFENIIDTIDKNKIKVSTKKIIKIVLIILGIVLAVDFISMVIYFLLNGTPS